MLKKLVAPSWAVLEYGWYPLLMFMTTPYFLHTLGATVYGYWMLLTAAVGFGVFLNVGTGAATIKQVSAGYGCGDDEGVSNAVRTSLALALIGGSVLAVFIGSVFGIAGNLLFPKMHDPSLMVLTGVVAALLSGIEQIDNVFASVLKGAERFGAAARIEMLSKTAQTLTAVGAVAVWGSIEAIYVSLVLVALVRLGAKWRAVLGLLGISSLRPSFINLHASLHYAKWGWLQGLGGVVFGIADRMLIGSFMGAASLAHYSVASQLAQQIHAFSAAAGSVIFPKISRIRARSTRAGLWRITKWMAAGNVLSAGLLALGLFVFGRKILALWLGAEEAAASTDVLRYLAVAYWLLAINVVPHFILLGLGKIRVVALANVAAGVVSLIAMPMLAQHYGLEGVGVARIIFSAIALFNVVSLFRYFRGTHESAA